MAADSVSSKQWKKPAQIAKLPALNGFSGPMETGMSMPGFRMAMLLMTALLTLGQSCVDVSSDLRARADFKLGTVAQTLADAGNHQSDVVDVRENPDSDADVDWPDVVDQNDLAGVNDTADVDSHDSDSTGDTVDSTDASSDICVPDCGDRKCGPDGCGGECGVCPLSKPVCYLGTCKKCTPSCAGKECGPDGCGGICGTCSSPFSCVESQCQAPPCDSYQSLWFNGLDNCDLGGFAVLDSQPQDGISWNVVSITSQSPTCSLYLGNPETLSYGNNDRVTLELISPEFTVPAEGLWKLVFFVRGQAEAVPAPQYPYDYDVLYLDVEDLGTGTSSLVFSSKDLLNNTNGLYVPVVIDLSSWAGSTLRLRFSFDTVDSIDNYYEGFFLDSFEVTSLCPYCNDAEDCGPSQNCVTKTCVPFSNNPTLGTCLGQAVAGCCAGLPDEACDDNDPCTVDYCDPQLYTCRHDPIGDPLCRSR